MSTERSANYKHGLTGTPIYRIWRAMKDRCLNPNDQNFHRYGGRGIAICERWETSFINFFNDMGERPQGGTLERINNQKGYSPDNCRWATMKEQTLNTRRNRLLTYKGETLPLGAWADRLGLPYFTLHKRFYYGWSVEKALETPVIKQRPRNSNGTFLGEPR